MGLRSWRVASILACFVLCACPRTRVDPPIVPSPEGSAKAKTKPDSADLVVVAQSDRAFALYDIEGGPLVQTGTKLARAEGAALLVLPPPPAKDAGAPGWGKIDAILGRWPGDARVYIYEGSSESCSWISYRYSVTRWQNDHWVRAADAYGGASMATHFPYGQWTEGRIVKLGYSGGWEDASETAPKPTADLSSVPGCGGSADTSFRMSATWTSGKFAVAEGYAYCAGYDARHWGWSPGSSIGRLISIPPQFASATSLSHFVAASSSDMDVVGKGWPKDVDSTALPPMKPFLLHFDGKSWKLATLPANTEEVVSLSGPWIVVKRKVATDQAVSELFRRDGELWEPVSLGNAVSPKQVIAQGADVWVTASHPTDASREVLLHNGPAAKVLDFKTP